MNLGKNLLDIPCLRNIYFEHIHSHILYGLSVWGSMIPQSVVNNMYKIQKKCIQMMRPIGDCFNISHVFKELQIIPIQKMIQFSLCKLGHNISQKRYLTLIINLFDKFGGRKTHRYPTRNKHIPNLQKGESEQYQSSFLCRSIVEYNKLPNSLKTTNSTRAFLSHLKKVFFT